MTITCNSLQVANLPIQIYIPAVCSEKLFWYDADRPEQRSPYWVKGLFSRNGVQPIGNTNDLRALQVLVTYGLREEEQTIKTQIKHPIQIRVCFCTYQRPQMENLGRRLFVFAYVGEQLIVIIP